MWTTYSLLIAMLFAVDAHATQWTYDGLENGQSDWGELSKEFEACSNGSNQSPISIGSTTQKKLPALQFGYQTGRANFAFNRHTAATTAETENSLKEGTEISTLKEMLIRSPSEHQVGDVFYFLELQLVHETSDKRTKIVSIFVKEGKENLALKTLLNHFPDGAITTSAPFEWQALLPENLEYYAYTGSLSYPPCTEGVEIRVLKTPLEASEAQITQLVEKLGRSSRATQPTYMRTIYESGE